MIKKLLEYKTVKYTISSLVSSAVEFIIFFIMTSIIWGSDSKMILISTLVSRPIGTIINFIINKYWCFKINDRTLIQSIEFSILFLVKLYLSFFFVNMIVERTSINATIIKVPIDIMLFFVGYVIQNFIIFKRKKDENN